VHIQRIGHGGPEFTGIYPRDKTSVASSTSVVAIRGDESKMSSMSMATAACSRFKITPSVVSAAGRWQRSQPGTARSADRFWTALRRQRLHADETAGPRILVTSQRYATAAGTETRSAVAQNGLDGLLADDR
jgi:hypothetical protein